ncbi:hypothetical protein FRC09_014660, partial [Ceratobasidium sp. 395]
MSLNRSSSQSSRVDNGSDEIKHVDPLDELTEPATSVGVSVTNFGGVTNLGGGRIDSDSRVIS